MHNPTRRARIVAAFATVVAMIAGAGAAQDAAVETVRTPAQFKGPYYPDAIPRDTDNDLVQINASENPAQGEVVYVSGRVVDLAGEPVRNVLIELWQTDSNGVYLNNSSPNRSEYDQNFQGFGRVLTGPGGEYYFRTLRPASHIENGVRRARHFHFAVIAEGRAPMFTQLYIEGEVLNENDPILNSINDPQQRSSVVVPLLHGPEAANGGQTMEFKIVLGFSQDE